MNNREQILNHTGKNQEQNFVKSLEFLNEEANTGFMATLFTLLSNIKGIARYIDKWAKVLFPLSFAFKAVDYLLYQWKFRKNRNKNAMKTATLILKTLGLGGVAIAVFGVGSVITAAAAPIVFAGVIGMDVAFNLGRSIAYRIKAMRSKDPIEKSFYHQKANKLGIKGGIGLLALGVVTVGMIFAPYIVLPVIAAVAVVAVVALVTVGILGIIARIKKNQEYNALKSDVAGFPDVREMKQPVEKPAVEPEVKQAATASTQLQNQQNLYPEAQPLIAPRPANSFEISKTGFFSNRINLSRPLTRNVEEEVDDLREMIKRHRNEIQKENKKDIRHSFIERNLWSQEDKRLDKIAVLNLIERLINNFDNIAQTGKFKLDEEFSYMSINDVIFGVDRHITKHYPKAFQSFKKDIGGVEALTKRAYQLLIAYAEKHKPQAANDRVIKNNRVSMR